MSVDTQAAEQIKTQQLRHWDNVADGWTAWLEWTERSFAPITDWLATAAGWAPGRRVLDVACGPGYPALAAARAVAPGGHVTAVDLSANMVAGGTRRTAAAGLDNIAFEVMDAEALRFAPDSFDAVTGAYGLMFCPDPSRALAEAHRVLAPGGRVAMVTWDEPPKSPFFTVIRAVAEKHLSLVAPEPNAPGPFRLASATALESLLERAGFTDVQVDSVPKTFEFESPADYFRCLRDFSWKSKIAALSEAERQRFEDDVAEVVGPYTEHGRVRLVATSLGARGRK